eukprot:gene3153-5469_t
MTTVLTYIILFVVTAILFYTLNYFYEHFKQRYLTRNIPGESVMFPFLVFLDPKKLPLEKKNLVRFQKEYGDFSKLVFGTRTFYYVNNTDVFKRILVTEWKKFGRDPRFQNINRYKKLGLFSLNPNDEWKRHRTILGAAFSDVNLKQEFETNINKITDDLMKRWNVIADKNGETNASKDFGALTLDAIGISGFGREFKTIENQDYTYADIINTLFKGLGYKVLLPKFMWLLPIPFLQNISDSDAKWGNYLKDIVETRKAELKEKDKEGFTVEKSDLLSRMMKSHIQDENPFDQDELLSNTNDFIAAGHETTAHTLTWIFYFLSQNPKYQQMICDEAIKEFGDEKVLSYEKLANGFSFTKAIISETLRLKNPAYLTTRYSFEDIEVEGHKIPKHSNIVLGFCNASVSEKIWGSDAKEFRPERFFEKDMKELRYVFSPFSMGPRVCIGKKFSEMEMILILAKAMMKFRLKATDSIKEVGEVIELTMKPSKPVIVSMSHYKQ